MDIIPIRKILLCITLCYSFLCFGQESATTQLNSAIDSLDANPNYSYKVLSKISKDNQQQDSIKSKAKLYLGSYFNSIGVVDSSMYYTRASLIHLRNKKHLAQAYRLLGSSFRRSGNMDEAIEMLYRSLKISEEIDYLDMITKVKSDFGILYANNENYDKSIQFFEESNAATTDKNIISSNYINIGAAYFRKKDYDNAEKFFLKAYEMIPPNTSPKASATLALNIGDVLHKNKKYEEALAYFNDSKKIADLHGFKDKSINAIVHKSKAIAALGKPKEAINLLNNSIAPAKLISNLEIQKNIYENLTNIYASIDDYKSANLALNNFHALKDSISDNRQKKTITELEVKYETATKQKEILLLKEDQLSNEAEIKRQRLLKRFYMIGFIIVLIPIIGLLLVYYQKLQVKTKYNAQKEEINRQKTASFLKEQELKLANTYVIAQNEERNRIARELHDSIGGNLAAIKLQMINIEKDKKTQATIIDQLDNTYQQVREISHNLIPKKINQTAFANYIREYIDTIEKVTEPDINFIPHPVEKINTINDNQKVEIFRIIQELMTNALKHAKAKVIEICLNAYNDSVEIIFEDDGIGFDYKKETNGIGLQNIKKRLTLLKAKIDIDSAANRGTAIRIEIPTVLNDKK
ncbi:Signal transduction histidine kinase [Aquimarina amphilecti]|uniref:histidine kinase n=1 Tax=Aquimarina amphilecti TaxID=1038014 RepID=A0A1H7X9N9_AQUAM|nr:sensor histidine kinase [Aquimarina amphilecti]SEM29887.1 Signal transduction histidine kinase [Aquimarina amphilecti]